MECFTELARLAMSYNVPSAFIDWMDSQGLHVPDDLAIVAATETQVDDKLLAASGVEFQLLGDRVAVTRLWMHCRGRVDREAGVRSGRIAQNSDDSLDSGITTDLQDLWYRRHCFTLSTARVLSDTLFARRYKELNANPRRLTIILPENLRTSSSIEKRGGRLSMTIEPGMPTTAQMVDAETVSGHDEFWTRVRADFSTMSLVTVSAPEFFPYDTCERFLDNVRTWLFQRFNGTQAPLEFYKDAYNKTMQVFVEGVRTGNRSLKELTAETSAYQHFWTVYTPAGAAGGSHTGGRQGSQPTPGATADVSQDLMAEVARLRRDLQRQQGHHDRQIIAAAKSKAAPAEPRRYRSRTPDRRDEERRRRSPPRKGNGKGKGKGKGKGNDRRHDDRRRY